MQYIVESIVLKQLRLIDFRIFYIFSLSFTFLAD